jgi:hypothetical protein
MFIGIIKARILEILDFVICGRSIAFRIAPAFRLQNKSSSIPWKPARKRYLGVLASHFSSVQTNATAPHPLNLSRTLDEHPQNVIRKPKIYFC